MLRFASHVLATCASIAGLALLASTAAAELPIHLPQLTVGPDGSDLGPDPFENPEEPEFGRTVVIRDELAFVGMPAHSLGGRVAVFRATPTALFRTGTLTASDAVRGASFGRSLAYRDGIVVVGDDKAAYIFQRSNGVWKQRQKLTAPAADNANSFADALRYEDGTLAIGANNAGGTPGVVYIYERSATGKFVLRGKLVSTDSALNDGFGAAISTAGPVMVVGSPGIGTAYVFRRNSSGVWRQHQTLIASELEPGSNRTGFGVTVAIDRGMIIVGAPYVPGDGEDDIDFPIRSGAAYGFVAGSGLYVETFKLRPRLDEIDKFAFFGRQLAMFGERIVVEAQHHFLLTAGPQMNGTLAFTYTREGSSVIPRGVAGRGFASTSLSLANQRLVVGQPCTSTFDGGCLGGGRVELYNLNVFE
jgi:hypothetical protein